MLKKFINISLIALFATSCGDTLGSVKRGLTGAKANSADEFMVQKKDPLILPPDFENLPTPDETNLPEDEFKIFETSVSLNTKQL